MQNKIWLVILLITSLLFAQESVTVEGGGYGENQETAYKAALRDALMKVVGSYISSTSIVDNYTMISDQIINFSGGFIEDSKLLESTKDETGMITVRVEAKVRKGKVKERLQSFKGVKLDFVVDNSKLDAAITKTKFNKENITELLKAFNDEVLEPIRQKKAHSLEQKGVDILEVMEYSDKERKILLKNINTEAIETKEIRNMDFFKDYENIDKYMIMRVSYKLSLKPEYLANVNSFLSAAFDKIGENLPLSDLQKEKQYIVLSKLTTFMQDGSADFAYKITERFRQAIFKQLSGQKKGNFIFKISTSLKDKGGFVLKDIPFELYYGNINDKRPVLELGTADDADQRPIPRWDNNHSLAIKDFNDPSNAKYNDDNSWRMSVGLVSPGSSEWYCGGIRNFLANENTKMLFVENDYNIIQEAYIIVNKEELKKYSSQVIELKIEEY